MQQDMVYQDILNDYLNETQEKVETLSESIAALKSSYNETLVVNVVTTLSSMKASSTVYDLDFITFAATEAENLIESYEGSEEHTKLYLDKALDVCSFIASATSFVLTEKWTKEKALEEFETRRESAKPEGSKKVSFSALIVGADKIYSSIIRNSIEEIGITCDFVKTESEAFRMLTKYKFDYIILSYYLTSITAIEMMKVARVLRPGIEGILITSKEGDVDKGQFLHIVKKGSTFKTEIESIFS